MSNRKLLLCVLACMLVMLSIIYLLGSCIDHYYNNKKNTDLVGAQ